jgi:hypothetical protein
MFCYIIYSVDNDNISADFIRLNSFKSAISTLNRLVSIDF